MPFNGVVKADKPTPAQFGLFSAAKVQKRGTGDEHWAASVGFTVEDESCSYKATILADCTDTPLDEEVIDLTGSDPWFEAQSFFIKQEYSCENSIGINAIDRRAQAVRLLENISEFAVEQELLLGQAAQGSGLTRYLTSSDTSIADSTARKPVVALGLLEQAFYAGTGGTMQGTVHLSPLLATVLGSDLDERDGKLYTNSGSLVVAGSGYTGKEPASATAATPVKHWMYITGPVHVDLGAEELVTTSMAEAVNPVTNAIAFVAERPAAVYFSGCQWFASYADVTL